MKQKDLSRTVSNKNAGIPKVHVMPLVKVKHPIKDNRNTVASKERIDDLPSNSSKRCEPQSLLIPVQTVAAMLSISKRQVSRLRDAGAIPQPIRLGGAVRWRADEIEAWIQTGCAPIPKKRKAS